MTVGSLAGRRWRGRAACRDKNTDLFYGSKDALRPPPKIREICESCTVRASCLLEALERGEHGVWGGLTEKQRRILLRRYRRTKCPSCGGDDLGAFGISQVCKSCGLTWLVLKIRTARGVEPVEVAAAAE